MKEQGLFNTQILEKETAINYKKNPQVWVFLKIDYWVSNNKKNKEKEFN